MIRKPLIFVFIIARLFTGHFSYLCAQNNNLFFRHFDRSEGLSQNSVYHIAQDKNGFVWLATGKGLNRFDGYTFSKYFHARKNKYSISSNRVVYIKVDKWNRLWLATDAGLNLFDQETGKFHAFHKDSGNTASLSGERVKCMLIDKKNHLWVGTRNGLNVSLLPIDSLTQNTVKNLKFKRIKKGLLSNTLITSLFEDIKGTVWVGTINGLNKLDPNTFDVQQYFPAGKKEGLLPGNKISSTIQDTNNELWIATQNGLYVLNPKNNNIRNYKKHPFFKENIRANHISSILLDKQNRIWLGTYGNGLVLYNHKDNTFTYNKSDKTNPNSLANNHTFYLFEDNAGNLFASNFGTGFCISNIRPKNFTVFCNNNNKPHANNIRFINQEDTDNLWLGIQNSGFCKFNLKTNNSTQYELNPLKENGLSPTVKCMLKQNKYNFWIGTLKKGFFSYNIKSKQLQEYKYEDSTGLKSVRFVFDIKKDSLGNLWIASWGDGLFKLLPGTKKLIRYSHSKDNSSLSSNSITSINIDKNDILLTTWGGGLCSLDTKTGKFKHFIADATKENNILSNYCTTLYIDKEGNYWIGTTVGLCKFNKKTKKFTSFTSTKVIFSEIIYAIQADVYQNLWISTNMGISRLNTQTLSVQNYDISDGLPSNEHYIGSSCKFKDGRISLGGKNGFAVFEPEKIIHQNYNAPVNLTNFQLSYKNILPGKKYNGKILLNKSINQTDTLYLSHKENAFNFEFSACIFNKAKSIRYAFMLKGLEKDWNYVSWNQRLATYTNMDPGTYTLLLKASNTIGEWNKRYKKIVIIIKNPFWKTIWFRISTGLIFVFLVLLFIKIRIRYLIKQKNQLEKKVEERTVQLNKKNIELANQKEELVVQAEELSIITEQLQYLNNQLEIKVAERTEDLNQALGKAEDAQKLISSFLSNMSHELRTPLNAISGFTQLITDIDLPEGKKQKYGKIINENIETLITLMENVMSVAKLHTNQYRFKNSVFDLSKLCDEVIYDLKNKRTLNKKELLFTQHIDTIKHLQINSDPKAFRLILYNLIENALKYTEKGKVDISCKLILPEKTTIQDDIFIPSEINEAGILQFTISDTGAGISKNDQKYIFEAFKKLEHDKKKLYRGTGLGLALVKNLTGKLHGSIKLESELGKGTIVRFTMPISLRYNDGTK